MSSTETDWTLCDGAITYGSAFSANAELRRFGRGGGEVIWRIVVRRMEVVEVFDLSRRCSQGENCDWLPVL